MDNISFVQVESAYVFTVTVDDFAVIYLELPFPSRTQVFKRREVDVAKVLHVASLYLVITTYPDMIVDGESGEAGGNVVPLLGAADATREEELLLGAKDVAREIELLRVVGEIDGALVIMPSYVHCVYPRLSNSDGGTHTFSAFEFVEKGPVQSGDV